MAEDVADNEREIVEAYLAEHELEEVLNEVVNDVIQDRPAQPLVETAKLLGRRVKPVIVDVSLSTTFAEGAKEAVLATVTTSLSSFTAVVAEFVEDPPDDVGDDEEDDEAAAADGGGEETEGGGEGGDAEGEGAGAAEAGAEGDGTAEEKAEGDGEGEGADDAGALLRAPPRLSLEQMQDMVRKRLVGQSPTEQSVVDGLLQQKPTIAAHVVLAVSMACCRAGARHKELALHAYIAKLAEEENPTIPVPLVSMLHGGELAPNKLCVQEVFMIPIRDKTFAAALATARQLDAAMHVSVKTLTGAATTSYSARGALAPQQAEGLAKAALGIARDALERGQQMGRVLLGVDIGATQFGAVEKEPDEEEIVPRYNLSKWVPSAGDDATGDTTVEDLVEEYMEAWESTPLAALEDGFHRDDPGGLLALKETLETKVTEMREENEDADPESHPWWFRAGVGGEPQCVLQIATDRGCRSTSRLEDMDERGIANTLTLSMAKGRTVSGAVALAQQARSTGWGIIVTEEETSADVLETFAAEFSVGVSAGQYRGGGLHSAAAMARYNVLAQLAAGAEPLRYVGPAFRNQSAGEEEGDGEEDGEGEGEGGEG